MLKSLQMTLCFALLEIFLSGLATASSNKTIHLVAPSPVPAKGTPLFPNLAPPSMLQVPVVLSLISAQQSLEKLIPRIIQKSEIPLQNEIKVEFVFQRQGSLQLKSIENRDILLSSRFCGKARLGGWLAYIGVGVDICFEVALQSRPTLHSDWNLTTETSVRNLNVQQATTQLGPFTVSFRELLNKYILPTLIKFAPLLDREIAKAYEKQRIRQRMEALWRKFQRYHKISLPKGLEIRKYAFWFMARPLAIFASQPIASQTELKFSFGLKAQFGIALGSIRPPHPTTHSPLPKLLFTKPLPSKFQIHLPLFLPWRYLQPILQEKILRKKLSFGDVKSFIIHELAVSSNGPKVFLSIRFDARTTYMMAPHVVGQFTLEAKPSFKQNPEEICFEDLRYDPSTKNYLHKMAMDYFVNPMLQKTLQKYSRYTLHPHLKELKRKANQTLKQLRLHKIKHQGQIEILKLVFLGTHPDGLLAIVDATGRISVEVSL